MNDEFEFEESFTGLPQNPGSFDNLDYRAKCMLEFPSTLGFGRAYKRLSTPGFQSSLRFLVMPPFTHPVVGASYSSAPIGSSAPASTAKAPSEKSSYLPSGPYFLAGEASWDGVVEAVHIHRLSPRWCMKNLIVTSFSLPSSIFMTSLRYSGNTFTSRLSYSTDKHIVLMNVLKGLSPNWSLGMEALYSVEEAKPGVSVGLRYATKQGTNKEAETQFITTLSVMGHVKLTYIREVLPNLHACVRYGINTNDLQTTAAFALERWPSASFPYMVRAKYDLNEGLGMSIGTRGPQGRAAFMFSMEHRYKEGPSFGLSFEL